MKMACQATTCSNLTRAPTQTYYTHTPHVVQRPCVRGGGCVSSLRYGNCRELRIVSFRGEAVSGSVVIQEQKIYGRAAEEDVGEVGGGAVDNGKGGAERGDSGAERGDSVNVAWYDTRLSAANANARWPGQIQIHGEGGGVRG